MQGTTVHTAGQIDWQELVERRARDLGITQRLLFELGGVDYSQWTRWKARSTGPKVETLNKLLAVTAEQVAKRRHATPPGEQVGAENDLEGL